MTPLADLTVGQPGMGPREAFDLMNGQIVQLVQGEKLKLAFDDFEYWITEIPSDDHCDMDNVTSSPVRKDDASIISVPRSQWDEDSAEQLANIARNREARKRCVVHKVLAARTLRDGFAPKGPRDTAFEGARELRFIESALRCCL